MKMGKEAVLLPLRGGSRCAVTMAGRCASALLLALPHGLAEGARMRRGVREEVKFAGSSLLQ